MLAYIQLSEFARLGFGVSPTMVFRIPLNGSNQARIGNYYINNGRFFVPEAIINFGYQFQEVEFLLSTRVLVPISNLWDGSNSSFAHGLTIAAVIQFRFILPEAVEAE